MSDIVTRLLLKTNNFDANLEKSKKGVNSFQSGISNMAKTAGSSVVKLAGAIGLVVGATETFGKIMGSQQSTQDEWDNNIFAIKTTVDKFFTSINNGDWTSFQNGFMQSIAAAKQLSAEIDALNDKRLSLTYIKSESLAKIEDHKAIATDSTLTKSERQSAFIAMQKEREELTRKTNETIKKETDALIKTLNVQYGDLEWTEGDIIKFVIDTNFTGGSDELVAYKKQLEELKSKEQVYSHIAGGVMGGSAIASTDKSAVEKTKQFKLQNLELEKQRILEQEIDEKRAKTVNILRHQAMERRELSALAKVENRINKQINSGGGGKEPKDKPKENSIAWYDSQIASQNKKLIAETDMQARGAIQTTINELEQKKINLKFVVDKEAFKTVYGEMKDGALSIPVKPTYEDKTPTRGKEGKNLKLPKYKPLFKKEDIELNQEYAESLSAICATMGALSVVTDESAATYIQWGANVVSSIAQAIPAIQSLIAAKQTEAVVNGVASASETPVVGWLLAGAAVASVVAAMASIPKFATGGIVPGTSFTGDKVPALLNSGEMILNHGQQSRLFDAINSGDLGGGGNMSSTVTTSVRAKDIILTINNELKSQGKKPIS